MRKFSLQDSSSVSTRLTTPEGFLRGTAALMRTGIYEYDAGRLGVGPEGQTIRIMRTPETVFHPKTLDSLRGAAITTQHTDIDPFNQSAVTVGNLAGEPRPYQDSGIVESDIIIRDSRGLSVLNTADNVSLGYDCTVREADEGAPYDYLTVGPMVVNHVALVRKGRAGEQFRVYDSEDSPSAVLDKPAEVTDSSSTGGVEEMTPEEMVTAIKTGMQAYFDEKEAEKKQITAEDAVDAVMPSISQLLEQRDQSWQTKIDDIRAEIEQNAKVTLQDSADDAEAEARKAADELAATVRKEERDRFMLLHDAIDLIPESKHEQARDATTREILLMAVGDSIESAEEATDDYLRGVFTMALKTAKSKESTVQVGRAHDASYGDAYENYIRRATDWASHKAVGFGTGQNSGV